MGARTRLWVNQHAVSGRIQVQSLMEWALMRPIFLLAPLPPLMGWGKSLLSLGCQCPDAARMGAMRRWLGSSIKER